MKEGDVVIVDTSQAGSVVATNGEVIWVLLRSGEVWIGQSKCCRHPQSPEDLEAAVIEVSKPEPKRKRR